VDGVSAVSEYGDDPRGVEQILQAHGAVLMHRTLDALVCVPYADGVATAARVAVKEILTTSNATDATPIAVKGLFLMCAVVPKVALIAVVGAEGLLALDTRRPCRLPLTAPHTNHLTQPEPVQLVLLVRRRIAAVFDCVVAVSAPEHLIALRTHHLACPPVVCAAQRRC